EGLHWLASGNAKALFAPALQQSAADPGLADLGAGAQHADQAARAWVGYEIHRSGGRGGGTAGLMLQALMASCSAVSSASASRSCITMSGVWAADSATRRREVPGATVGGRMAGTYRPRSRRIAAPRT